MLDIYLPKEILVNVLYKYLYYEDLIKICKLDVLDHLRFEKSFIDDTIKYELYFCEHLIHIFSNKSLVDFVDTVYLICADDVTQKNMLLISLISPDKSQITHY